MTRRRVVCAAGAIACLGVRAAPDSGYRRVLTDTPSPGGGVSKAYFGAHFHRLLPPAGAAPGRADIATEWVDGAVGSLRLWDSGTRWGDVAPSAGAWAFERMDGYVASAESRGASVLYTLGSTPRWASARPDEPGPYGPGCAAEPLRLAHWEEYVSRVAQRYRGRIQAYELWNEPHFSDHALDRQHPGFFSGSVAQMVELARSARRVLDHVDPAALLTTPGFVNGPHRLELFLRGGGAELVQVVAYHFYAADALQFTQQVAAVRSVMGQRGVAHLPLWNTECGVETYGDSDPLPTGVKERLTEAGAAAKMAQFLILGAALDLQRFFYYAWDNDRSGMVDRQGVRRPRFEAMLRVQQWLSGVRSFGIEAGDRTAASIAGARGAERFVFAWSDTARTGRISIPPGWTMSSCESLLVGVLPAWPVSARDAREVALSPAPVRLSLVRA